MWNSLSSDGYSENDEVRVDVVAAEDAAAVAGHRDIGEHYHSTCCAVGNTWNARMR